VSIGGGTNNRFNLEDEIFVKDNHYDKLFNQKICKLIKKNKFIDSQRIGHEPPTVKKESAARYMPAAAIDR
ncbi:MAG: hypothetical protein VX075_10445, partial [Pseudomonadota bacterium]|nr:hypothetical protein [Pseudomonadota bacterium]